MSLFHFNKDGAVQMIVDIGVSHIPLVGKVIREGEEAVAPQIGPFSDKPERTVF